MKPRPRGMRMETLPPKPKKPSYLVDLVWCPECQGKHILSKTKTGNDEMRGSVAFYEIRCEVNGKLCWGRIDGQKMIEAPEDED